MADMTPSVRFSRKSSAMPRPVSIASTNVSGLPRGWSAVADPASGQTYYFNAESGETQWEVPRGDSLRLSAKIAGSNF